MFQRKTLSALAVAIGTMFGSFPTYAADPIARDGQVIRPELVSVKTIEAAETQTLTFAFSGGLPAVKTFRLANPSRMVVDFARAANKAVAGSIEMQGLGAKSVEMVGDDARLRAVIHLHENSVATDRWDGQNYIVSITRKGAAPFEAQPAPADAKASKAVSDGYVQEIIKVDFNKGKTAGSGRLIIDLTNPDTPIDIKTHKNGLIIDFLKTSLPAHLLRKFEVADKMTPVSSMEFRQLPDRGRLVLRTQGPWEQSAYQVDNKFVFDVRPVFNSTVSKNSASKKYKGDKLTLNFQNIEVRSILQVLSDFSGLNIITSDTVGGSITLRLKDVPWDQALDLILQAKNLDMRSQDNVIWVAPANELRQKEADAAKFRADQALVGELVTESFQVNYAPAKEIQTLLTNKEQRILSSRGSAVLDARTNLLFVQDIPERVEAVRAMIKKVDVPVRQVMIEARIVEASDSFGKSLGARLGYSDKSGGSSVLGTNLQGLIGSTSTPGSTDTTGYFSNLPATPTTGRQVGLLSFILFNRDATRFLNLELSALVSDGRGQILSNPRVVTADKQEASIEQGTEIPYSTIDRNGRTSTSFKKAVLALKVKPQITPDGNVLMDLLVNKDSMGVNTSAGPTIDTKNVKTQVLVEDGGTVVVGGIYTQDDRVSEDRVPFFGDLPYIGSMFKTKTSSRDSREMLVFITPKVVGDRRMSDDMDASSEREELIKPVLMSSELAGATGKSIPPLLLPSEENKK